MERHVANYLMGLLMMTVLCGITSAFKLPFDLPDDDPALDLPLKASKRLFYNNAIDLNKLTKNPKKKHLEKIITVNLEESRGVTKINQGESYTLTCVVNAYPMADAVYLVHGRENLEETIAARKERDLSSWQPKNKHKGLSYWEIKYPIDCAEQKDQGHYYCVAFVGEEMYIDSTDVIVKYYNREEPEVCDEDRETLPMITTHLVTVLSPIGSDVVLPCRARGTPQPTIHWSKEDGTKITNHYNSRYEILPNGDLLIENLLFDMDFQNFSCTAKSPVGSDVITTFIYPLATNRDKEIESP